MYGAANDAPALSAADAIRVELELGSGLERFATGSVPA
jgi:hypothetical protein